MRVLFVLPGLQRINRGAEVAFLEVGEALHEFGHSVTFMGSGPSREGFAPDYIQVPSISRSAFESFPKMPIFRNEFAYEELSFLPGLLRAYRPSAYDVTVTCSYPFVNWVLARKRENGHRPLHIFVTQNGDWPAFSNASEFRWFHCDGLVCINPDYYHRNSESWPCSLIPNGVRLKSFRTDHQSSLIDDDHCKEIRVLMVSALSEYKRVLEAIEYLSDDSRIRLTVVGDGPLRADVEDLARALLPGRFELLSVPHSEMPSVYRSHHVFLHMALDEPFGNVYVEALASGLPIVANSDERVRWIVGDQNFLADCCDPGTVLQKVQDAYVMRKRVYQSNLQRSREYDWELVARKYECFFQQTLQRHYHDE